MTKIIATHRKPDADALVSTWLAKRFLFASERTRVQFVPRNFEPADRDGNDCVLDVGGRYQLASFWFDHKPPAVADRHESCATRMLWEHLISSGHDLGCLYTLVAAVHDGDSSRRRGRSKAFRESKRQGLHCYVNRIKGGVDDRTLMGKVHAWLDRRYRLLTTEIEHTHEAHKRLRQYALGRVYLHCLESRNPTLDFRSSLLSCGWKKPKFSEWDPNRTLLDLVALKYEVPISAIRRSAENALWLDRLTETCGCEVRDDFLLDRLFDSTKDMAKVGRRMPPRQEDEVKKVRAGKKPMMERDPTVYDTPHFPKAINRLARSIGCLAAVVEMLKDGHRHILMGQGRLKRVEEIRGQISALRKLLPPLKQIVRKLTVRSEEDQRPRTRKPSRSKRRSSQKPKQPRFNLRTPVTFTRILLNDLPQLPTDIWPTPDEKADALSKVNQLAMLVDRVHQLWEY